MTQSLPQGGNAALAQADPTARVLFIGLNWERPAASPPVEIDASLFLLDAAGVVRDDRDYRSRC
ncbi:MAG: TerD family protein [Candidatus Competibacter sp.]|nr:TerD family protein [Candidatus Competibacter sp.]